MAAFFLRPNDASGFVEVGGNVVHVGDAPHSDVFLEVKVLQAKAAGGDIDAFSRQLLQRFHGAVAHTHQFDPRIDEEDCIRKAVEFEQGDQVVAEQDSAQFLVATSHNVCTDVNYGFAFGRRRVDVAGYGFDAGCQAKAVAIGHIADVDAVAQAFGQAAHIFTGDIVADENINRLLLLRKKKLSGFDDGCRAFFSTTIKSLHDDSLFPETDSGVLRSVRVRSEMQAE